ncbi:hypothetical protein [Cryobacterium sp. Y11]|uniref:hypothetical protein n=1 Tax=Cryobacterium sp. Y11 TaxID=2045016 RepID=UPI000CE55C32|nr:hypothetical protein [Cryobacterium sp. Y11]
MKLAAITILTALILTGCASTPATTPCEDSAPIMEDFAFALKVAVNTEDRAAAQDMLKERIVTATEGLNAIVMQEGDTEVGAAMQTMSDALSVLGTNFSSAANVDFTMAQRDFDNACGN